MGKVRSASEFDSSTVNDLTWRIKEISDFKFLLKQSSGQVLKAALRSSVPLLYAHWEGHVVFVARSYVEYLSMRKLGYSELRPSFSLTAMHSSFVRMSQTSFSIREQVELTEKAINIGSKQFREPVYEIVSSRSNLNSKVLEGMCSYLSFAYSAFEADADFIDKILVHRRNSIAHGEWLEISESDFEDMSMRVIGLMRGFRNEADNHVQLKSYLR